MASIYQEQFSAQRYELQRDPQNPMLVQLTFDNVARVEAMIHMDSRYNKSGNPNARPIAKYQGSTAYWLLQLKEILICKKQKASCGKDLKDTITEVIKAIDRDNGTRLSVGKSRDMISDWLFKNAKSIVDNLRNRELGFHMIEDIASSLNNARGRENYSFATKFCHYACIFWFEGDSEADNYSIYDNIVSNALPKYAERYGVIKSNGKNYTKKDFNKVANYRVYSNVIDAIIKKSGAAISRNGFDHLLWYANK